jgi:hypothetical protein
VGAERVAIPWLRSHCVDHHLRYHGSRGGEKKKDRRQNLGLFLLDYFKSGLLVKHIEKTVLQANNEEAQYSIFVLMSDNINIL